MSKIVQRTLNFLELFAQERRPLLLSDISRLLGLPVSSCHDVLHTLQDRGYVYEVAPRGGFYPTQRLYELARTLADHDPILLRAEHVMRAMRDALDESILLSKVHGLKATYLLALEPSHPLRFLAKVGDEVRALHATSAGKAILAGVSAAQLDAYLKSTALMPMTPRSIKSKALLRKDLRAGNRKGWFLNNGESLQGVMTLSGRFTWNKSTYILTIAGPISRLNPRLKKAANLLLQACRRLELPS